MRNLLLLAISLLGSLSLFAQSGYYAVSGRVMAADSKNALPGAVVQIEGADLWAVTNQNGEFSIPKIQNGTYNFVVSSLGYVNCVEKIEVKSNLSGQLFTLQPDNLAIDEVVVTAKENQNAMSTSRTIGKNAIDHLQMVNTSDISALLPGGKTVNPDLLSDNLFSLRDGGQSAGNATFGTAVEVDGVRLSTNASFGSMSGASTRNVASTNIASVEVITGVPSAEYGDVGSGIVKVHTRRGKTPYNLLLSTNPHTKQVSVSKGFDLGQNRGVLNSSLEYTRATKNPTSPYESYNRKGLSLNYSNVFSEVLRFNFGITGNLGGQNTKDDPDAYSGEYTKAHDNALRVHTSLEWQINKPWITALSLDGSINYMDNLTKYRSYNSSSSQQPAVHATDEGYFLAGMLPFTYYATQFVDSKELDYALNLKATWARRFGNVRSNAKVGFSWNANGNVGDGEYYSDPSLAPHGYRPRPYTDIPYMHNLALYIEESLTVPIGSTTLQLMAGLRGEKTCIKDSDYNNTATLSPRLNLKYSIGDSFTVRGGWGLTEKLPSFNVLYPNPQYRDIQTFSASYNNNQSLYVFYTQPYELQYNPDLKWQRNRNAEVGVEFSVAGIDFSVVGYFNRTENPYELMSSYSPFSYNTYTLPSGYKMPSNPEVKVDSSTGIVYVRDSKATDDSEWASWKAMAVKNTNYTFVENIYQSNGATVDRKGLEFVVNFPQINPLRTQIRLDGSYAQTQYVNTNLYPYYNRNISHPTLADRSYPYVGVYANAGTGLYNGRKTKAFDMNLTTTTHIPSIRMVVTLRLEASLLRRSWNLSEYAGKEYAFNIEQNGTTSTGGSIYDGGSYTAIYPVYYMDLEGTLHPFTSAEAAQSEFSNLIIRSGNTYVFDKDGYDPYFSANLSITKEIGNHVSLSFYANNFTNSRRYVTSYATGVKTIFTPDFYYGLTLRFKF